MKRIKQQLFTAGLAGLLFIGGCTYLTTENDIEVSAEVISEVRDDFRFNILEPIVVERVVEVEKIVEVEVEKIVEPEVAEITYDEPIEPAVASAINLQPINGWFNVFEPSNLGYDDLMAALDYRTGFHEIVPAFLDAERVHGVNALYLMSTLGLESGWGKFRSGVNNIAGFKDPNSGSGWKNFDSLYDCVMLVADELASIWRYDVGETLSGITSRYCPEYDYMDKVMTIMNNLQNNLY